MTQTLTRQGRIARLRVAAQRALHPMRRRRAIDLLKSMPKPTNVLVICHGNVCRSPLAAEVLARRLNDAGVSVVSAGLAPYKSSLPTASVEAAARRDIDISSHSAQRATHAMVAAADLVVVMEMSHARVVRDYFGASRRRIILLGDCDPGRIQRRSIPDPMGGTPAEFDSCYARIERCGRTLADVLLEVDTPLGADNSATATRGGSVKGGGVGTAASGLGADFLDGRITRSMARAIARAASLTMENASTSPGLGSVSRNSS
jgi:protein-tyrosine phosphatase